MTVQILAWLAIGRMRLVVWVHVAGAVLRHGRLSCGRCRILRLVADGRQLHGSRSGIRRGRRAVRSMIRATVWCLRSHLLTLALVLGLALGVFFLFTSLPLLTDLFEFCIDSVSQYFREENCFHTAEIAEV
jgi:hypothetical protein